MVNLSHRAIRWGLYVGVSLVGIAYELFYTESVRWPLIGGYLLVIAVIVYIWMQHSPQSAGDENQTAE